MKKNFYYLLSMMMVAMLCVGFTSCGDDDDDDDVPGQVTGTGLVGVWQQTAVENHFYGGTSESEDFTPFEKFYQHYLKFNENGTGKEYEYEYDPEDGGEWYIDGFSYHYDAKNLTITNDDGVVAAEVRTLDSTTLVIKFKDTDDNDVEYQVQTYKRVSEDKIKDAKEK